ncbi:MAG: hypothetical protein HC905_25740 [Bacteroidales bacterium]|nr:hypothetical protein [Bacteroidales bacterium]
MKLTLLLIVLNLANSFASVYSQKVSLDLKNVKFEDAINELSKQTNLDFAYSKEVVNLNRLVSINVTNTDLKTVLDRLLDGTQLLHLELNGKVYLGPKALQSLLDATIYVQQQKLTGTITDATNGEAIVGANVIVEGTTLGTISDENGKFTLEVKNGAVIIISFLGFNTERVSFNGETNLGIKLYTRYQKP